MLLPTVRYSFYPPSVYCAVFTKKCAFFPLLSYQLFVPIFSVKLGFFKAVLRGIWGQKGGILTGTSYQMSVTIFCHLLAAP